MRLEVGSTDPPPIVMGDDGRLRQVLANLLTNAVEHTPAGTPVTVTVTTGRGVDSGQPSVTLTVADEGPGISAEAAGRVFERFYRADPSRDRADGSTGLGVAIVTALVAGHGGTVGVDTAAGGGGVLPGRAALGRRGQYRVVTSRRFTATLQFDGRPIPG